MRFIEFSPKTAPSGQTTTRRRFITFHSATYGAFATLELTNYINNSILSKSLGK